MSGNEIYRERVVSKWVSLPIGLVAAAFLALFLYQMLVGPVGEHPAPAWLFLVLFLIMAFTVANFVVLTVVLTPEPLRVRYGLLGHTVRWENIADCYRDEASSLAYGGWGIRLGAVNRKWRLVYNTTGSPRVVLVLRQARFKEFVFSTCQPEKVIALARSLIEP